ncbi:sensor histidine kinase [Mobilicoccus caccae]|uniref:histidine kinase n=1 Tax=Mobilicoccus caccae TaxID=1859295 RepID=A0ABQ6IRG7_9MICO|nr:histidine kinase [Mobilicoccus caccae]GMA39930.1 hypothetical protein GCM10025883_19750 [Mobilicoccus caccae]
MAIAEERARFADELHDRIAHEVTGIVVLAQGSSALARGGPVERPLELIEEAGLRAMEHIRGIVGRSGPPTPDRPGHGRGGSRASAVASVTDVSERLGVIVRDFAETTPAAVTPPAQVDCALSPQAWELMHRVTAESLTNVRRHAASARHVRVHLAADDRNATLWITDDGDGGGLGTGGGSGLRGLGRKAKALGGELTAHPVSQGGWQVRLILPAVGVPAVPAVPPVSAGSQGPAEPVHVVDRNEDDA